MRNKGFIIFTVFDDLIKDYMLPLGLNPGNERPKLVAFQQVYDRIDQANVEEHWDILFIDVQQDFNLPTKRTLVRLLQQKEKCFLFLHQGRENEAHIKQANRKAIAELLGDKLEPFVPEFHHHSGALFDLLVELSQYRKRGDKDGYLDVLTRIKELYLTLKVAREKEEKSQFLQHCMSIDNIQRLLTRNGSSKDSFPFPKDYLQHPPIREILQQLSELPANAFAEQRPLLDSLRKILYRDF